MNIANKLTLLRMILIPVFIVFFYIDIAYWNYYAALVFIIAALTDLFDGALARKRNIVTNFGKLIDPIADKLLVCSALILLAAIGWVHELFVIVLVGREFAVSGFRLLAAADGKVLAASSLGKMKTIVQIVAVVAVLLQNGIFGVWIVTFGFVLICISVVLSLVSGADYFIKNKSLVKDMF
ncbi:MAG: CDP-diacylglycerol--glycerol-3-phosphate 3-phosphatidyltransferase [Christensenellales bacterium]|jgi:CDP-diacylglycerol--glycerol-3-phosphate 3-phosphatidyltransferase